MNIVFVGDSLTYDAVAAGSSYGSVYRRPYGRYVMDQLVLDYSDVDFTAYYEGVGGANTDNWVSWINSKILVHAPDVVSIMIGTNDSATSEPYHTTLAQYDANLRTIVAQIRAAYPEVKILFLTMPTTNNEVASPYRTNAGMATYADRMKLVAADLDIPVADVFAGFSPLIGEPGYADLYSDGTHLSDEGVQVVTGIVYPAYAALFATETPLAYLKRSVSGTMTSLPLWGTGDVAIQVGGVMMYQRYTETGEIRQQVCGVVRRIGEE